MPINQIRADETNNYLESLKKLVGNYSNINAYVPDKLATEKAEIWFTGVIPQHFLGKMIRVGFKIHHIETGSFGSYDGKLVLTSQGRRY